MTSIFSNSGKTAYGVKKYIVDLASDISKLPTNVGAGSTAFVIEDSTTYMLNNQKIWVKIAISSGGESGGGTGELTGGILDGGLVTPTN